MSGNITKKQRRMQFIGGIILAFFLIIMVLLLSLNGRKLYAASNTSAAFATATAFQTNSNDPYAQFCSSFYHVTASTLSSGLLDKYNQCLNLSPQFQSYLQAHGFTYGSLPSGTATLTPTGTSTSTPTDTTTPTDTAASTPTGTSSAENPLCSCSATATPTPINTVTPTSTTTSMPIGTATLTPIGTTTSTPTGAGGIWPNTSLVALEIPADAGKTGNSVPSADATSVENDLTTYLQAQASTTGLQAGYQDALHNWVNDPLLPLALVTYTFVSPSGQPSFADATDNNPSFTALSTFLSSDPIEVARIQSDLAPKVKSTTYKPAWVDCSFTVPSLTQGYQDCLGADTLIDVLYAEKFTSGTNATTFAKNATSLIENEFTGEVNSYLQANASTTNAPETQSATDAQKAYTFIASIQDQTMKDTLIDHMLTNVVTNVQTTSCVSPVSGSPTPVASATPCASPTVVSPTPVSSTTPLASPTVIAPTPVSSTTPCASPASGSSTLVSSTTCTTPVSEPPTLVPSTPVPSTTPCANSQGPKRS